VGVGSIVIHLNVPTRFGGRVDLQNDQRSHAWSLRRR
jgi:hypothetical protein